MWKLTGSGELLHKLRSYRPALLVLAAGMLLLLLPTGKTGDAAQPVLQETESEEIWLRELQEELTEILSRIEGAGKLTLMLSVESGMQKELARDSESELRQDQSSNRRETVILSSSGGEEVVVTRSDYPVFRGAVIVCQGGDQASVRLAITEAVTALTGLSSDKISVIKGNGT